MALFTPSLEGIVRKFTKMSDQLDTLAEDALAEANYYDSLVAINTGLATEQRAQASRAQQIKKNVDTLLGVA